MILTQIEKKTYPDSWSLMIPFDLPISSSVSSFLLSFLGGQESYFFKPVYLFYIFERVRRENLFYIKPSLTLLVFLRVTTIILTLFLNCGLCN